MRKIVYNYLIISKLVWLQKVTKGYKVTVQSKYFSKNFFVEKLWFTFAPQSVKTNKNQTKIKPKMETKPKTKTLAFSAEDVEGFKEFFPEYKSGNMTGRELGRKLVEILRKQTPYSDALSLQNKEKLEKLTQNHSKHLRKLAEKPSASDSQNSRQKPGIRLKHIFKSSKTKTTMNFYLTIKKTKRNGN